MASDELPAISSEKKGIPVWLGVTCTLTLICLAIAVVLFAPGDSIEGNWRNHSLASCLCDSYNFLEFQDGTIRFVSDTHLSGEIVGTYERVHKGKFKLEFPGGAAVPMSFDVDLKSVHFVAPEGHMKPFDHFLGRLFYRPIDSKKAARIAAGTLARNRQIRESEIMRERLQNGEDTASVLE